MIEKRQAVRFPVRFRSSFTTINVVGGEGSVVDLSVRGCRIEASTHVNPGTILEMRLYSAEHEPPIGVGKALVRWARGKYFGVEFVDLTPEEWARLQHAVKDLERHPADRADDEVQA